MSSELLMLEVISKFVICELRFNFGFGIKYSLHHMYKSGIETYQFR